MCALLNTIARSEPCLYVFVGVLVPLSSPLEDVIALHLVEHIFEVVAIVIAHKPRYHLLASEVIHGNFNR